jgi:DNA-binding response OmpR family regulator
MTAGQVAEADAFLTKPFASMALLRTLRNVLEASR